MVPDPLGFFCSVLFEFCCRWCVQCDARSCNTYLEIDECSFDLIYLFPSSATDPTSAADLWRRPAPKWLWQVKSVVFYIYIYYWQNLNFFLFWYFLKQFFFSLNVPAYREKLRDFPLVSLFCSCILPEPREPRGPRTNKKEGQQSSDTLVQMELR